MPPDHRRQPYRRLRACLRHRGRAPPGAVRPGRGRGSGEGRVGGGRPVRRPGGRRPGASAPARRLALSSISIGQRTELQLATLHRAASLGVVAVHEMAGPEISSEQDLVGLLELATPELPAIYAYWGELRGAAKAAELGSCGAAGDLFLDGSIGSHTACMNDRYADADTVGYLRYETGEVAEHILECTALGV